VNMALNIRVSQIEGILLTGCGAVQFTRTQLHVACVFHILSRVVYDVGG
jgi:hypothetical protein